MSKPYYVKYETPKDLVNAIYEASDWRNRAE